MKYVKMLGLAVMAAMALMAFIGAGTASATVLCKTATNPCTEKYGDVEMHAVLEGTATLETTAGTALATCTVGTMSGTVAKTGSSTETVSGPMGALTWGPKGEGCNQVVSTLKTGSLEVHYTSGNNGSVTASATEVTVEISGVSCRYESGAGLNLGTLTGGKPATLTVNTVVNEVSPGQFLCPDDARWTAAYEVTSPNPLYVSNS